MTAQGVQQVEDEESGNTYGTINPEALAKLRARIGKEYPIEEPHIRFVNRDSIHHAARAIGDANPLWNDPDYAKKSRFGKLVAPPALLYGAHWGAWDMRRGEGLPGVHGLHSSDHWTYYQPVLDGDEVHATKTLTAADEMQGRWAGRSIMQKRNFKFFNQKDELVAVCLMNAVRGERNEGKSRGKYADIKKATYTPAEIAQIDSEIEAEIVRGAEPRNWEDVEAGEALQPLVRGPLTVPEMMTWIQGIGSPHVRSGQFWLRYRRQSPKVAVPDPRTGIPEAVERVHWDDFMAAEIGMPAAYDYGSQRGAWATHLMTNWAGDDGFLAELNVTYRGMYFLGDTLRIKGAVTEKWVGKKSGIGYVDCTITGVNQRGDVIMPGHATVALPSKAHRKLQFPIDVEADRG
jgi:acyl dehydratase